MAKCWLYIYKNKQLNSIYIGIANSMERVYQKHNSAAEKLREAPGSVILQTIKPFSSRPDARKAEAIAIHVAAFAETTVWSETEDGTPFNATNISGVHSTGELGPAILTKSGAIPWSSLTGTLIVPISADSLDDRPAPFGAHSGAIFSERAHKHWQVAPAKRPKIIRLIALLNGSGNIILGDWDVAPERHWVPEEEGSSCVAVPLVDAQQDDPRGVKGQQLSGYRANSGVGYSPDFK